VWHIDGFNSLLEMPACGDRRYDIES